MLKKLNQKDFHLKIIKDLGREPKKQRFAIFECPKCKQPFKARVTVIKRGTQKGCNDCKKQLKIEDKNLSLFIKRMNSHARYNSRKRNMELPFWKNTAELHTWLLTQPNWKTLWEAYEKSDYDKKLAPSIDRLDNTISYTKENIELVTWEENDRRGTNHLKTHLSAGAVHQYYENGLYINTYKSYRDAARHTGVPSANISKVCNGIRKKAGGFKWELVKEMPTAFEKIRLWATTRNLIAQGDTKTQLLKLTTELAELSDAILADDRDEFQNAIADCIVVLTNIAAMEGFDAEILLDEVIDEIGLRKGQMINGTFVKDK